MNGKKIGGWIVCISAETVGRAAKWSLDVRDCRGGGSVDGATLSANRNSKRVKAL